MGHWLLLQGYWARPPHLSSDYLAFRGPDKSTLLPEEMSPEIHFHKEMIMVALYMGSTANFENHDILIIELILLT